MKRVYIFILLCAFSTTISAVPPNKYHLIIAPSTLTDNEVTLLWDKQYAKDNIVYEILLNGKLKGSTAKTNFTIAGLSPATVYNVSVRIKSADENPASINFKTATKGNTYNILDFGAKNDTAFKNTAAIQAAINACAKGGTVLIPKGVFVSGALFLKSDMTLYIDKGAVLKGSTDTADYLPLYLNRFEGWELRTYASLLNAGTLNRNGTYNVKNLRIPVAAPLKAEEKN